MQLRELEQKDATLMLEWMRDDYVVHDLATDFGSKTMEDCLRFIEYARDQYDNFESCKDLHLAIIDDSDEYMGTVSLKNINRSNRTSEFAITIRAGAMGKGFAKFAMDTILNIGFSDARIGSNVIYWCVDKKNTRAQRFYNKHNYTIIEADGYMLKDYEDLINKGAELIWYAVSRK